MRTEIRTRTGDKAPLRQHFEGLRRSRSDEISLHFHRAPLLRLELKSETTFLSRPVPRKPAINNGLATDARLSLRREPTGRKLPAQLV